MHQDPNINTTPTTRRRLGAALLAIGAGSVLTSGVAAGMAASVTDLAPANPDAALIALCDKFRASEAAFCAIYDSDADDATCATLAAPILNSWSGTLDRMAAVTASTPEGLVARAMVLAQHSGIKPGTTRYAFAFEPEGRTVTGRLLHYLLRDAVALAGRA